MERWRQFSGRRLATRGRMKLRIGLALLLLPLIGQAQQLVDCDPAQVTPCTTSPSSNTGAGDPAYLAFGKYNANWLLIAPLFAAPTGTIVGNAGSAGPVSNLTTLPFTLSPGAGGTGVTTLSGPIKGNGSSPFSSAASVDITALWTGSCTNSTFLRGDGQCVTPATGGSSANPSALVGPTAVIGSAPTFMTSDSAPALNQAANYTLTGVITLNGTVAGTGLASYLASPPAIGTTSAAAGGFTTLTASSTVSGAGFNTLFASPPAIGSVSRGTGAFTTLSATTPMGVTSGGTGIGLYTTGQIIYASASTTLAGLSDVAAGSYLRSGGTATAPSYSTNTIPNTDVTGDLWYGSAANTMTALAGNTTTAPQFLTSTGTGSAAQAPVWAALSPANISGAIIVPGGQSGIAFIEPSSGSVGNNCAITGLTALPTTYAGAYIWMVAGSISSGSTAGWYWFVGSSATAGTCYNSLYTTGQPLVGTTTAFATTGPGAFTGASGSQIMGPNVTLAGGTIGNNGHLQIDGVFSITNNTNSKQVFSALGGTISGGVLSGASTCSLFFVNGSSDAGGSGEDIWYNRGNQTSQICSAGGPNNFAGANVYPTVTTSSSQPLALTLIKGTATDNLVLEGFSFKVYPN
jgi:hypothetical protein